MVDLNQIAMKGDIAIAKEEILQSIMSLVAPELAKLNDRYMTVKEIAEFTKHSQATVRKWMNEGKKDRFGYPVKLEHAEFSHGDLRALRSEVIRFGQVKDVEPQVQRRKTA
ncbi:hypothetical protein GU926_08345 [Nibribacter ruber]|uniref:Uncharacterized protein n=1 Tax=Nibribacter ruber TaxID=2698458 RepID=A0A6P1NUB3_9BACT|nr:helix-turn-helix domain-containing protein [Nibribacter ruber]QHL87446.1 hypothetical protein GU926_08345 [Nibribacter ruber]